MRLFIILFFTGISYCSLGQQSLIIKITGRANKIPVEASISEKETGKGIVSDTSGIGIINFVSGGRHTLIISAVGYEDAETKISIPYRSDTLKIELESLSEELEEVVIQSTRTSRTIQNVPTRVETIEMEEIDEKNNMRPANVAMILHESTGI